MIRHLIRRLRLALPWVNRRYRQAELARLRAVNAQLRVSLLTTGQAIAAARQRNDLLNLENNRLNEMNRRIKRQKKARR